VSFELVHCLKLFLLFAQFNKHVCMYVCKSKTCGKTFPGATEIARTDIARPSKLWGLTPRDWTRRDHIARVDIARPDNAAPDSRGGHRRTGQGETISQGWTSRDLTTWHQIKQRTGVQFLCCMECLYELHLSVSVLD